MRSEKPFIWIVLVPLLFSCNTPSSASSPMGSLLSSEDESSEFSSSAEQSSSSEVSSSEEVLSSSSNYEEISSVDEERLSYEAYLESFPAYPGTFDEWKAEKKAGNLDVVVTFDVDGGQEVEPIACHKGERVNITQVTSKEKHGFVGWFLDEGKTKAAPATLDVLGPVTLFAGFEINKVSITYLSDGAEFKKSVVPVDTPLEMIKETPEKLGYLFKKWTSEEPIEEGAPISEDLVFSAEYEIDALELPVVDVHTENRLPITSKTEYSKASFTLGNVENPDHEMSEVSCGIRGRGNSTWAMPKKPYRIKFDKKQSLFGSSYKAKSWVLLANYCDKSLSRNALALTLSQSQPNTDFASCCHYVDLYLDDVYQGVYLLADQIQTGDGRVAIDESLAEDGDNGYLLELNLRAQEEGLVEGVDYFVSNKNPFEIKTPDVSDPQYLAAPETYVNYIKGEMDGCFAALGGEDWDLVVEKMDVESFCDAYIVQELFKNTDVGFSSFYVVKDKAGKIKAGPAWDFDISSGNCNYGEAGNEERSLPDDGLYAGRFNPFFARLLGFEEFVEMVSEELRKLEPTIRSVLEKANPLSKCGIYQIYKESLERNFLLWDCLGKQESPQPREVYEIDTVKGQFGYLHSWLLARFAFLLEQFPNDPLS